MRFLALILILTIEQPSVTRAGKHSHDPFRHDPWDPVRGSHASTLLSDAGISHKKETFRTGNLADAIGMGQGKQVPYSVYETDVTGTDPWGMTGYAGTMMRGEAGGPRYVGRGRWTAMGAPPPPYWSGQIIQDKAPKKLETHTSGELQDVYGKGHMLIRERFHQPKPEKCNSARPSKHCNGKG